MIIRRILKYITIIKLKLKFGNSIRCPWSACIDPSIIVRINRHGKVIFGSNVELRSNVIINVSDGGILEIGNNTFINDYCCMNARSHIKIGDNCQIGQGVKIYDHDHDYTLLDSKNHFLVKPVLISDRAWIGSNAVILRGTTIGERCVIGAGTVIKRDVPDTTVCYNKAELIVKHFQ